MTAIDRVVAFERTMAQGVFRNVAPAVVAQGLRQRLTTAASIGQSSTSLCGPAVVLFFLALRNPDRYVQYILDLYQTGRAQLGRLTVEPGESCRNYTIPAGTIHPVDWIALASLRDSENDFFNYDSVTDEVGGITMPGDLTEWFRKVGFSRARHETNVFFTKDERNLRTASAAFAGGSSVCLFLDANVLSTREVGNATIFPNHWVGLTSVINIVANQLSFTVYTWGTQNHRVPATGTMSISAFLEHYYGYVVAS